MAGIYSTIRTWNSNDVLYASDIDNEFQNVKNNMIATSVEGYSTINNVFSLTRATAEIDPAPLGVYANCVDNQTLAGEIEKLRFVVHRIIDGGLSTTTYGVVPSTSIANIQSQNTLPANRIVSGATRGTISGSIVSGFPAYLLANGASGVKILGSAVNLIVSIKGILYKLTTDISSSALSAAVSSNNTCTVNLSGLVNTNNYGLTLGEDRGSLFENINEVIQQLTVSSMGSAISNTTGTIQAFKVVDGSNTEYFTGKVESTTSISYCKRGYFFNVSGAPIQRIGIASADTITLMRLTYVFIANTSGTFSILISYDSPIYSYTTPTSPNTGQFWYDETNKIWKQYSGSAFVDPNCTFVGVCFQDSTGSTIGARSEDFYAPWSSLNSTILTNDTTTTVRSLRQYSSVSVFGVDYKVTQQTITYGTDVDPTSTVVASQRLYYYVTDQGYFIYSNVAPYNRSEDLRGYYHPYNYWRCIGSGVANSTPNGFNTGSGLIANVGDREYYYPFIANSIGNSSFSTTSGSLVTIDSVTFRGGGGRYRFSLNAAGGMSLAPTGGNQVVATFTWSFAYVIASGSGSSSSITTSYSIISSSPALVVPSEVVTVETDLKQYGVWTATLSVQVNSSNTFSTSVETVSVEQIGK